MLPAGRGREAPRLALAHTEKGARYNLAKWKHARRNAGAGWEITGETAIVVLGAPAAGKLVGRRREDRKGRRRSSSWKPRAFRSTPYVTLDEQRAADVAFSKSPAELLGVEGGALALLEEATDFGTALICAEAVGAMKFACDTTLEYLKTRKQFGVPIGAFQALQHRMVDMFVAYEQAKLDGLPCLLARRCTSADASRTSARGVGGEDQDRSDNCSPHQPGSRCSCMAAWE